MVDGEDRAMLEVRNVEFKSVGTQAGVTSSSELAM
jgi:hypothetical protein